MLLIAFFISSIIKTEIHNKTIQQRQFKKLLLVSYYLETTQKCRTSSASFCPNFIRAQTYRKIYHVAILKSHGGEKLFFLLLT